MEILIGLFFTLLTGPLAPGLTITGPGDPDTTPIIVDAAVISPPEDPDTTPIIVDAY